jgi:glycosyltransferase involved in cell wall biosynthesis
MLTRAPDSLWIPAHVLPLIHPRLSFVTVHDLGQVHFPGAHTRMQRAYHNASIRWNALAAQHIFADSEATRDDLTEFFKIPLEKITVVYPAYDTQTFQTGRDGSELERVKEKYRIGNDYILAIGTIHPRKNYSRLIDAFRLLETRENELVIVGKRGWLYESIYEYVHQLGLDSQIRFIDYVPSRDLAVLLSGARLLAFPSLYEGFGLPILEAQACGTPVVCSMTSSLPEAAGDAALFVDPMDVNAIAGGMDRALSDGTIRNKLIARGLENVKRFSWESSARQILDVMCQVA